MCSNEIRTQDSQFIQSNDRTNRLSIVFSFLIDYLKFSFMKMGVNQNVVLLAEFQCTFESRIADSIWCVRGDCQDDSVVIFIIVNKFFCLQEIIILIFSKIGWEFDNRCTNTSSNTTFINNCEI